MGRPGITEHDVELAAETLRQQGKPVTARAVREELGTGSYGKITELLKVWEAQKPEQASNTSVDALLPTQLSDGIHKLAASVFDDLKARAEQQIQGERDQHRQDMAQSEKLRADAVAAATEVTEQNDALKAELAQAKTELSKAKTDAAAAQVDLRVERAARQTATERADEHAKHNVALNAQLERADAQLTAEKKQHAEAQERHSADFKAQQERLDAQLTEERQQHENERDTIYMRHDEALNQARQDTEERLSDMRDQLNAVNKRAGDLQQRLDQAVHDRAEAQGALAALREQLVRQSQDTAPAVAPPEPVPEDGTGAQAQEAKPPEAPKLSSPVRRPPPRRTEEP